MEREPECSLGCRGSAESMDVAVEQLGMAGRGGLVSTSTTRSYFCDIQTRPYLDKR